MHCLTVENLKVVRAEFSTAIKATLSIMTFSIMALFITLSTHDTHHNWHSAQKHSTIMLSVIIPGVIMSSVIMLSVIMPSVIMPGVLFYLLLCVVMLSVVAPNSRTSACDTCSLF